MVTQTERTVAMGRAVPRLIVILALVGAAALTAAPEPAGLVVAVRGDVTVTHGDGRTGTLALKDSVWQGDQVKTGARGRVQICFSDDTILSLGRNTHIEISECVFRRSEGQAALSLNLNEGVFRIVGGAIMKIAPENFKAITPTVTIGIRGSSFAGEVTAELTRVVLLGTTGGGITVSNDDGYRIVYIPGTGLSAPRGGPLGRVRSLDALAAALLRQTTVGGSGPADAPGRMRALLQPEGGPLVDPIDAFDRIPGYQTDTEAQAALAAVLPGGTLTLGHGNAVGLDLENGWALRSLEPTEVSLRLRVDGARLTAVESGGMVLHAQGTGDSADTFPAGPDNTPPLPFSFVDGTIRGNEAIRVTEGTIRPPEVPVGISNWGWWEMDLNDPNGTATHHATGLWQATSLARTAADLVRDVLLGRDFTGTYAGSAHCLRNGTERFDGTSQFALDFRAYAFTGALDFTADNGPTMGLAGTINETGIHGRVSSISTAGAVGASSLRGFFYGAEAQSLQGAFDAQTPASRYIGIFEASSTGRSDRPR